MTTNNAAANYNNNYYKWSSQEGQREQGPTITNETKTHVCINEIPCMLSKQYVNIYIMHKLHEVLSLLTHKCKS
jgi:hypothetical protein